ncbi:hypothetical protein [Sinorhizobium psoraleae]|uniref:hypothetical protein n=1 Tax=Sinorhizobium psoraleae TaxID=520838 RepID=UPI001AEE2EE3|nr:hypothetical protein [Sinorhizobium psoraleae]
MEIDADLRGMLLTNRPRATSAIALHLSLRIERDYLFRRPSGKKATLDDVIREIVDGIWEVPARIVAEFARVEVALRAPEADIIAGEVYKALRAAFNAEGVRDPYDGGC